MSCGKIMGFEEVPKVEIKIELFTKLRIYKMFHIQPLEVAKLMEKFKDILLCLVPLFQWSLWSKCFR